MKRFLEPNILICIVLFVIHQIMQKGVHWYNSFLDSYLDDLVCMPIILTIISVERYDVYNAKKESRQGLFEIIIVVIALGILFEEGFPSWSDKFTKDYWDYLCYLLGGLYYYWTNKQS